MDHKTATLIGAAAALAGAPALAATPASEPAVPVAASYAELLTPIPNAMERLQRADAEAAARPAQLIEAQYYVDRAHHHHHHHHHHNRRWYMRNGYTYYNGGWVLRPRPRYHHHHHHHHHSNY